MTPFRHHSFQLAIAIYAAALASSDSFSVAAFGVKHSFHRNPRSAAPTIHDSPRLGATSAATTKLEHSCFDADTDDATSALHDSSFETSRRNHLERAASSAVAAAATFFQTTPAAYATYGMDANIQLPDVIGDMDDRNNKQCLAESLGTRQCLIYVDPVNQLYKGSDGQLLVQRFVSSSKASASIPAYIEEKQWSKVLGALTGPMGTLSSTMNELAKLSDDPEPFTKLSKEVRTEMYGLAGAVDKKQGKEALLFYNKMEEKLEKFALLIGGSTV